MAAKEYQRLCRARPKSGFAVAFVSRSSLWLGKDHLLCVDAAGYSETYKRFYFRDIQAVTLRESNRRVILNIVLGILTTILCLAGLGIWNSSHEPVGTVIFGVIAAFFLVLLLINTLKGPTVICHLRTAVQTEELAPLNRLRRAHKILRRIRPFISEAQGHIPPEELQQLMNQMMAYGDAPVRTVTGTPIPGPESAPPSA